MLNYENIISIFALVRTAIFYFFVLVFIKWLIMNIVQTTVRLLKKSIGEIIKNLDLLRFILDCVKEMCKNVVKKLPVIKRCVPD